MDLLNVILPTNPTELFTTVYDIKTLIFLGLAVYLSLSLTHSFPLPYRGTHPCGRNCNVRTGKCCITNSGFLTWAHCWQQHVYSIEHHFVCSNWASAHFSNTVHLIKICKFHKTCALLRSVFILKLYLFTYLKSTVNEYMSLYTKIIANRQMSFKVNRRNNS